MRKHSENSSNEFMSSSEDSLSIRQAVFFSFKEIGLKESTNPYNIDRHKVNNPSEMAVASFGDSACAFKLTGLKDRGVYPSKGNKTFMAGEVSDIADLGEEGSAGSRINTVNGSDDLKFLYHHGLTETGEHPCHFIKSFHKMQERRDFLRQDKFLSETNRSHRGFGSLKNIRSGYRDLSTSGGVFKGSGNSLRFSSLNNPCRGELFEEIEHSLSKDITKGFQFREGRLKDTLNLIFCRSDEITERFPFSGDIPEVSDVLRDRELRDRILVDKEESSNGKGVLFVCLGLSQRQLGEIRDQKGINDNSIDSFASEEGEEIDVIAASGLHSGKNLRGVFASRGDGLKEFREAITIHIGSNRETDIAFRVKTGNRERILGDINTDEQIIHRATSNVLNLGKASRASRPILHVDKDSETQSTYHGFGRQGTDSLEGSMTQVKWSSPAFPSLMGKTHSYKFYNTYS